MKGTSALTVAVCIVCFFIGYLTYLGATLMVDFMMDRMAPCENRIEACTGPESGTRSN